MNPKFPSVLALLPVDVVTHPDQSNWGKLGVSGGVYHNREVTAARPGDMCTLVLSCLSPSPGMVPTTFRLGLPISTDVIKTVSPYTHAHGPPWPNQYFLILSSKIILECDRLTRLIVTPSDNQHRLPAISNIPSHSSPQVASAWLPSGYEQIEFC